jgi:hypothetical protein
MRPQRYASHRLRGSLNSVNTEQGQTAGDDPEIDVQPTPTAQRKRSGKQCSLPCGELH